jgi:hypothetical protein
VPIGVRSFIALDEIRMILIVSFRFAVAGAGTKI